MLSRPSPGFPSLSPRPGHQRAGLRATGEVPGGSSRDSPYVAAIGTSRLIRSRVNHNCPPSLWSSKRSGTAGSGCHVHPPRGCGAAPE